MRTSTAALLFLCSFQVPDSQQDVIDDILSLGAQDGVAIALASEGVGGPTVAGPFAGRYRVLHGATACSSATKGQGNPAVHTQGVPTVGEPLRIEWTVNPTAPYETTRPAYLLVWFDEYLETDISPFGYRGCTLWAPFDRRIYTVMPSAGGVLTQNGGRLRFSWTPGSEFVGRKLFSQLVVYSPGANERDWLLSPGLETWVGN